VEDSAEATLRLYELAANLPNRPAHDCGDDFDHVRRDQRSPREQAPDELSEPASEDEDMPFAPPQEVEFRLDNDRQRLRQFEVKPSNDAAPPLLADGKTAEAPLTRDHPFTYLYPEWDFRGGAYRQHWCRVRERFMDEGTSDFYMEALVEYRPLVRQVVNRFEHWIPELFRKVTRRDDGEDLDLDAVIERFVDRRTGGVPREKLYWRRERTQRDVAVALLLDMSATTNEYVQLEAAKAHRPSGPSAQAYSDYLKRIAAGVDQRGKPLRRRAIDIEKQAAIVLCQALEKIGDSYALYAFSGSGRAEVEFYVVKDFHEPLSQRIGRRIDRIQPAHGTRMGAAIRHALGKLERVEANTRLLFLLSDGRPYDRDYGRDDADQEYALQDTRQALLEAQRRRIRPLCLTIDRDGEDYLRQMCDDIPYEVVTKMEELPIRLVAAYPKLTAA
jgi:nitric oxide reductase activation protein